MPFKETCPMEERIALFREYEAGISTVAGLCRRYGISRETFYVWRRRRAGGDAYWFEDRSHAPLRCPHATLDDVVAQIEAAARANPDFGPKKLKAWLDERVQDAAWPAASTIGDILKRAGLVRPRRKRRAPLAQGEFVAQPNAPNEEWCIDFKGWFRTLDGVRCDPLTITDTASRYLLETRIMPATAASVRAAMERVFADVGLPLAIRCDNGAPFGSTGAGGLSRLSVWWLRLGIEPRYIPPASPQDNGRHERMHRTMKADTAKPPASTGEEQQLRFDGFRERYNHERPHEALGQKPPARFWSASPRRLPARPAEPWYDADHEIRSVRSAGDIKWRGEHVFIGEALAGETIGLCECENGCHIARFCGRDLGVIGRGGCFLRFAPPRARLRVAQEAPVTPQT